MHSIIRLFRFLMVSTAFAVALVSCGPQFGSIGDFEYDGFWVVPRQMTYWTNDNFRPQSDLSAFASFQGTVDSIPVNQVEIRIAEDLDSETVEWSFPINSNDSYKFGGVGGKKGIKVSYGDHFDEYTVMVLDPSGNNGNGGDNGGGNNSGNGIGMEWGGAQ